MRIALWMLMAIVAGTSTAQVTLLEIGGGPGSNSRASVFTGSEVDSCPDIIGGNPNRKFDASQLVDSATSECASTVSGADAAGNGSASYFVSEVAGTITQITASSEGTASCSVSQTEDFVADAQGFGIVFVNVEVTGRVLASIQASVSSSGDAATSQVRVGSPSNCLIFGNCTLLNKLCSTTTSNGCFPPLGGFVDDLPDTLVLEPGTYRFDVNAAAGVSNNFSVRDPKSGTASASFTVTFTSLEDTGACCLPDGNCEERTEGVCNAAGGTYQGDGTTCATVTCPAPKGACCLGPGECDFITQAECQALSGFYRGDGVPCEDGICDCALSWASSEGGSFDAEASWSPAEAPEDCDNLTFDLGGEYDVTFGDESEARSLRIVNASPRFSGGSLFLRATDVGLAIGGSGTAKLALRSGEIQIPFGVAEIGTAAGAPGEFELGGVDGSAANCLIKQFDVGIGVAGKVNILKGGNLIAGDARIGVTSPEPSIMNVVDGGVFDMDSRLIVGNAGDAVLNVFDGGTVLCDELTTSVAGIGKLRLSDPGSSLHARGNADIGIGEVAELSIEKEATFTTDKILFAGKGGATTVTVAEQGVLNANEARIGVLSSEECFLIVKQGANFNVSTELGIAFSDATANVTEGGVITCGDLTLAIAGLGALNVAGQGSRVNVSGDFIAGFGEAAEVIVEKNATMRVAGKLTAGQGGRASVTVDFGKLDVLGDIQLGNGEFAEFLALASTINAANIRVGGPSFGKMLVSIASELTATSLRVEPNGEFRIESATLNVPTISFNGNNFIEENPRKQGGAQNIINGNVTFGASSVTVFSVADGAAPLLEINGSCALGGTAEVRFADDAALVADQELDLIAFGEVPTGAFSTFRFPTRSADFAGSPRVEDGRLILTVINPGSPVAGEGEGEGEGEGCAGCNAKRLVNDPWGALKDSMGDNLLLLLSGLALVFARRAMRD